MIDTEKAAAILRSYLAAGFDGDDVFEADVVRELEACIVIDLNDPATENAVAYAIADLAPEGTYVPLSQRYPWRFSAPTAGQQETNLVDAVVEALRGSASVHEAERIPHLVAPLRALAEALEHGALVPGPPPGRCGSAAPGPDGMSCSLRAGHTGQHETEWQGGQAYWDSVERTS